MQEFCNFCGKGLNEGRCVGSYLVNGEGEHGFPKLYACTTCMRKAEPGTKLAELRDGKYVRSMARIGYRPAQERLWDSAMRDYMGASDA